MGAQEGGEGDILNRIMNNNSIIWRHLPPEPSELLFCWIERRSGGAEVRGHTRMLEELIEARAGIDDADQCQAAAALTSNRSLL